MSKTAMGKLMEFGFQHLHYEMNSGDWVTPMEHWHPDRALAFGKLLTEIPYHQVEGSTSEWLGFRRANVARNPLNIIRSLAQEGEKKMAYDSERAMTGASMPAGLSPYKPRTFRETIQDQIAHHEAKKQELQAVLDSLTPEVEKFVEALQKANL